MSNNHCHAKIRKNGVRYRKPKVGYTTINEAMFVAEWMTRKFKQPYQPYQCDNGHGYHVGRTPSPGRMAKLSLKQILRVELGGRAFTHLAQGDSLGAIRHRFDVMERRVG